MPLEERILIQADGTPIKEIKKDASTTIRRQLKGEELEEFNRSQKEGLAAAADAIEGGGEPAPQVMREPAAPVKKDAAKPKAKAKAKPKKSAPVGAPGD